jgi:small subunit ribosomal protein S2
MPVVTMKALLESGVHFGHRTRRWDPRMRSFIFTERNGIHIIDLQQTLTLLDKSYELVRDTVSKGGVVLFVGTKKQAAENLGEEAERCGMPYVNKRWLGGTLTNFRTIRQRMDYMVQLEAERERGEFARLSKKEALLKERELEKLYQRFGGIRTMRDLPSALFIVDVKREEIAVKEANRLQIPIMAMVDSNCDPTPIDYIIPSNDDAIRAIKLITSKIADAVLEGRQMREALAVEDMDEGVAEEELFPTLETEVPVGAEVEARTRVFSPDDGLTSENAENEESDDEDEG